MVARMDICKHCPNLYFRRVTYDEHNEPVKPYYEWRCNLYDGKIWEDGVVYTTSEDNSNPFERSMEVPQTCPFIKEQEISQESELYED